MFQWISPNYEFRYVNIWPRPFQDPHPPIYIPGAGSTETMRFVAEKRYTYMSVYAPTRVVRHWFDGYRQAAESFGYAPEPEKIGLSIPIYVAETDEKAHREGRQHLMWLFHKGLKQGPELMFPPGYLSSSSMRGLLMAGTKPFPQLSYEELLAEGYAVVGSPESVAARLTELHGELGFGQIIGLLALGDISHDETARSMELFAGSVIPELRQLDATTAATLA
jgi:alkanesulfonate monooxygenase SsuD/methylene tetrahydromethanopterin reductase-like flavin-dependent oxidoreductase (luciferase family)